MKSNSESRTPRARFTWLVGAVLSLILAASAQAQSSFTSAGPITINDNGNASPFPSEISVSDILGTIEKVTVRLNGVTHNYPDDIDVWLRAPNGTEIVLMSDAGGGGDLNGINLTFDDAAASSLPDETQISSGTFKPTNYEPAGAGEPASPGTLSSLAGASANGTWRLFVRDDQPVDAGSIASWTLNLFTKPVLTVTNQVTMAEDSTATVAITVRDSDPGDTLTVTADPTPANATNVVDKAGLVVSGSGENRTLQITPKANAVGTATIRVSVTDGIMAATSDITLTVTNINDAPTITLSTNRVEIAAGGLSSVVTATLTDADVNVDPDTLNNLVLTSSSSNPSVVGNDNVFFSGTGGTRTFTIAPTGAATGTATVTIRVSDGSLTDEKTITVQVNPIAQPLFANTSLINIRDNNTADPYPSRITVSGVSGLVGRVEVTLADVNHSRPEDLDILLVGPGGQNVILMGQAGGANALSHARLTFSDTAENTIPDESQITTGRFKPMDYAAGDLTAPAPAGPYGATLGVFQGTSPNGNWDLYIVDRVAGGGSEVADGWVLKIFTAPTIGAIDTQTTDEDVSKTLTFTVGDQDGTVKTVTAVAADPGLVTPSVTFTADSTSGTLRLTPVANANGSTTITLTATDNDGFTATRSFTLNVTPVNDAPTISPIQRQFTRAGEPTSPIAFTVGDVETAADSLVITATSDNQNLVPNSNIVLGGSGANRTITLFPIGTVSGTTLIAIRVSDGTTTTVGTFDLIVQEPGVPLFENRTPITINDPPTATTPYPSTIQVSGLVGNIAAGSVRVTLFGVVHPRPEEIDVLLVGPGAEPRKLLLMSDAGGTAAIPTDRPVNLVFSDTAPDFVPAPIVSGTFKPTDIGAGPDTFPSPAPAGPYASQLSTFDGINPNGTWSLFVVDDTAFVEGDPNTARGGVINGGWQLAIHTAPVISTIGPQETDEDVQKRINFTIGDNQPGASITVTASSDNQSVVPNANLVLSGTGANRTLTITPAADQFTFTPGGTTNPPVNITIQVSDGVNTAQTTFPLAVRAVDDPPTISTIANQSTPAATQTGNIVFDVTQPANEPGNITVVGASSDQSLVPDANIRITPASAPSGTSRTMTILPAGIRAGEVTITVVATDSTGQRSSRSFVLTITRNLSFANFDPITINDRAPATPYPSVINVTGVQGLVSKVRVSLLGFTHVFPDDVDVLLVSPSGRKTMLMSDAGGGNAASNVRLDFDQTAENPVPDEGAIPSGRYKPANHTDPAEGNETALPAPAPAGPYGADLSVFAGDQPNGDWKLFVRDDTFPDSGSIQGGWILILETGPIISAVGDQTTQEDVVLTVPFTVTDSDTDSTNLTVTAALDFAADPPNNVVGASLEISSDPDGVNRQLRVTPAANQSGTNRITLTVKDPQNNQATRQFKLTVTPVDDPPTITTSTNIFDTNEDTPITITYAIADVDTGEQKLKTNIVVTSSNTTLVPNAAANINVNSNNLAAVQVTITPAANQFGETTITLRTTDGTTSVSRDVLLRVAPVNDPPTIGTLTNQTVVVGGAREQGFTVGDVETPTRNLVVSAKSSDQNRIPDANIVLSGAGDNRIIQYTTLSTAAPGDVTLSVIVSDGAASTTNTFVVTITAPPGSVFVNANPIDIRDNNTANPYPSSITATGMAGSINKVIVTIDGLTHEAPDDIDILLVHGGKGVLLLSDAGGTTDISNVRLTFDDSARALGDDSPIVSGTYAPSNYEGNNDPFPSPAPAGPYSTSLSTFNGMDANGDWQLFVVDDNPGNASAINFGWSLTVVTAPRFVTAPPAAVTWNEDETATFNFEIADMNVATGDLDNNSFITITASSTHPSVVPPGNVTFARADGNVTATLRSPANVSGTNELTITVTRVSDGASVSAKVANTVNSVNDLPTISRLSNRTTVEGTPVTFEVEIVDIDTTAITNLVLEASSSNQNLISNTNILFFGSTNKVALTQPTTLVPVTLVPNALANSVTFGDATITLKVTDLVDNSMVSSNFVFHVDEFNDPPTITSIPTHAIEAGSSTTNIVFTVGDPENGTLTVSASSSNQALVKNANIVVTPVAGAPGNRTVRVTAEPDVEGSVQITLTVADNGSPSKTASTTFTVNIRRTRERVFANTRSFDIPSNGPASDYPSIINVTGLVGSVSKVEVALNGFSHRFPDDVDVLLVGPGGQKVMLMSDAGGGTPVTGLNLRFADSASTPVPDNTLSSGTWKPANYDETTDNFPAPAPGAPYATTLATFNGGPASGEWKLFVFDDTPTDGGSISGGWSLFITTQPKIVGLDDLTTPEDTPVSDAFTVVEEDFASTDFTFEVTSSNPSVVANNGVSITGSGSNFTVTVTPQPNASGTADITVKLTNLDAQVVTDVFRVTVTPVNDRPFVTDIPDMTIPAGAPSPVVTFNFGDVETDKTALVLTVDSSNPDLIPASNVLIVGNELRVVPVGNLTGRAVITVTVRDEGGATGSDQFQVTVVPPQNPLFANTNPIVISDNAPGVPYPSTIDVSGVSGTITKVTVTLAELSHSFPDDVDVLLVGPQGQKVVLMSDAGGGSALSRVRLTFDDSAASSLPDNTAISAGTFKPTNYEGTEQLPAPAPTLPYAAALSEFNGTNPNGTWSLYVADDASPDSGTIFGGWLLSIVTSAPTISHIDDQVLAEDTPADVAFRVDDGNTAPESLVTQAEVIGSPILTTSISGTGKDRTLRLTPRLNANGSTQVKVTVTDGTDTAETTFNVTITAVNDAPVIAGLSDTSTPANVTLRQDFTVSDVDNDANSLTVEVTNANPELGAASIEGTGGNRTLVFTPTGTLGSATLSITASDGDLSSGVTVVVSVTEPVRPIISDIPDQTANEDTTPVVPFTVTSISSTLTVTAEASNTDLVTGLAVSGTGAARAVALTLAPNGFGTSLITITATDEFGTDTKTFLLTVNNVPDAPTLGPIGDQTTDEDVPVRITLDVRDIDTPLTELTYTSSNSNPDLVSGVTFSVDEDTAVATINLVPEASGFAAVSITVTDGATTPVTRVFALQVRSVNDTPSLAPLVARTINENTTLRVPLTVTDPDTPFGDLVFSGTSSNPGLIQEIAFEIVDSSATAVVNLVPGASGGATVTITVSDGNTASSRTFGLTVLNVANDPPELAPIAARTVDENTEVRVPLTVSDPDTPFNQLTFSGGTSNPSLVSSVGFEITDSQATAVITLVANATGGATITISVSDGETSVSQSFGLTVLNVPTPPALGPIVARTVNEDSTVRVPLSVTDPDTPLDQLVFSGTTSNPGLVREITFEVSATEVTAVINLVANATGGATVTITVTDGETDPVSRSFGLTVLEVPDQPTLGAIASQTTQANVPLNVTLNVSDPDTPLSSLIFSGTSSDASLIAGITFSVSDTSAVVTITPATGQTGTATVTITVTDGDTAPVSQQFSVQVNPALPNFVAANKAVGAALDVPGDGLWGEYWKRDPVSILVDGNTVRENGIDRQIEGFGPPNGTFTATQFIYTGNDLTDVTTWLGSDSASFTGTPGNLDDGAFRFRGYINVRQAGPLNIGTTSDDGSRINIAGLDVINNDGSHGDTTVDATVNFESAGVYPIEITYFNGDWTSDGNNHSGNPDPSVHGGANFRLRLNGADVTAQGRELFFRRPDGKTPKNIVWVSFHAGEAAPSAAAAGAGFTAAPDVEYTRLLRENDYNVRRIVTQDNAAVDRSVLDAADLVIISRSVPSGHYQAANETAFWNGLSTPTMILGGYINRQSRLGLMAGSTIPDTMDTVRLKVNDPTHPIFAGIPLDANNEMVNLYAHDVTFNGTVQRGISVVTGDTAAGGVVLATAITSPSASGDATGGLIIGEWQAGGTVSAAGADVLGGHRLVFLTGSREQGITSEGAGIFDLDPDGTRLFLNAVAYMAGRPERLAINFGADEPNGAGSSVQGPAGVLGTVVWNNVTGATGSASNLRADADGNPLITGATVEWTSNNTWSSTGRGEENNGFPAGPDRNLMTGYLDTGNATTTTITISGLPGELSGGYDVYVYSLGGVAGRGGAVRIVDPASGTVIRDYKLVTGAANPSTYVEDPGVDHNDTGNYLRFTGLTQSSIRIEATTQQFPFGGTPRAPVNAVELVAAVAAQPMFTSVTLANGTLTIEWVGDGVLEGAPTVAGPWTEIAGARSPYTTPADQPMRFFRLRR